MSRVYIFCEGKRDRFFLKRLIREKLAVIANEQEPEKLDNLLRNRKFTGVALIECGGYDKLLKQAAKRSRDLANNPRALPPARILVVGDSDKVDRAKFRNKLDSEIQKLKSNPTLEVREEGNDYVVLENLKNSGHTIEVVVLTVPDNLEKQLSENIKRLHHAAVKGLTDEKVINYYCDLNYNCDEEDMMDRDVDVVGPLLDSGWAKKIVDVLK